jgi:tellurite resistance-related uncharacterized protein
MPTTTPAAIPAVLEPPFDFSAGAEVVAWEAGAWVMMTVLPGAMLVMTVALSDAEEAVVAVVVDAADALEDEEAVEDFAAAADDELAELAAAPDEPPPPE